MLKLRNTKALLIAFALTGLASVTQAAGPYGSCDPHNGGCRDKIMQYITCTVKEQSILLRSLPNERAQAVGSLSQGDEVYISDTNGSWIFVQGSETYEGKTEATNGGWLPRSAVNKCHSSLDGNFVAPLPVAPVRTSVLSYTHALNDANRHSRARCSLARVPTRTAWAAFATGGKS